MKETTMQFKKKTLVIESLLVFAIAATILSTILPSCAVYDNISYGKDSHSKHTRYNVLVEVLKQNIFGNGAAYGSGVIISEDGLIVTAKHLLSQATFIRVTLTDGRVFELNNFYVDEDLDVGVVKLPSAVYEHAVFGDSDKLSIGDSVFHIGNPLSIFVNKEYTGKIVNPKFKRLYITKNIVDYALLLQMPVFPGCSGGGVYHNNKYIGMITQREAEYAIAISSKKSL